MAVFSQKYNWFDKPAEVIHKSSFKVDRVWSPSKALVRDQQDSFEGSFIYDGITYLIVDPNGNFYDEQIIKVPQGMEARRVGTVVYGRRTLPIIKIIKKEGMDNNNNTINSPNTEPSEDNRVFEVVEQMPSFPGGQSALFEWLSTNTKRPEESVKTKTQGRVIVTFTVECDGSITNPRIWKSVSPDLDEEAIRLIESMPHWIPGRQNGQTVRVKYTLPVSFR